MEELVGLDLKPTTDIGRLADVLRETIDTYSKYVPQKSIDEGAWETFLEEYPVSDDFQLHQEILPSTSTMAPWDWVESDRIIKVTIKNTKVEDVKVSETHIESPTLSGRWYGPIRDIEISQNGENVVLKFQASCHFPVLIRSGPNIDRHSAFFVAMIAIRQRNVKFFEEWSTYSGKLGDINAQHFLGRYLIGIQRFDEAAYWLARAVLEGHDTVCAVALAHLMMKNQVSHPNGPLAEHLFIGIARTGDPEAFQGLGELYLSGVPGVEANQQHGLRLLTIAAKLSGTKDAIDALQKAEKQVKKDYGFLIDYAISGTVIVGGALALFYTAKRFFKK